LGGGAFTVPTPTPGRHSNRNQQFIVDDDFIDILDGQKRHKMSHMKGHKPTMNDFGSNNLVLCVHALYLNVGTE
jgi:hypothetical protein